MPALGSVTFTSTHADGRAPTDDGNGSYLLKFPNTAESCLADDVTTVDLHQTVSIPVGYVGIIAATNGVDINTHANLIVNSKLVLGTGSPIALTVAVINVTVGALTPVVDTDAGTLTIVKTTDYKHDDTPGTWA